MSIRQTFLKEQVMEEMERLKQSLSVDDFMRAELDARDLLTYLICLNERMIDDRKEMSAKEIFDNVFGGKK